MKNCTNVLIFLIGLAVYAGYGLPSLYIIGITLASYAAGLLIPKHRWVMWVSVVLQGLLLFTLRIWPVLWKAQPFLMEVFSIVPQGGTFLPVQQIAAPIGISYFTLQIIAYHADLYKGKYEPEKDLLQYGLFVTYLPHIFIGPIEPYPKMKKALMERHFSWDGLSAGALRALWGLFKKLVIAARLGVITAAISGDTEQYYGAYALAAMLLYAVQLYADFSGGIDIVLGVSRMLGIRMSENFDAPYFSQTIQEFWQRWHITLGGFLRDYVYIPLGGNRKGKVRKVLNTLITFLVSGIWHGSNYLLWGAAHGIFVCMGNKMKTRFKTLNRAVTFLLVSFLWSFFIWPDTVTAVRMIGSVFTASYYGTFLSGISAMGLTVGDWIVVGAACLLLLAYDIKRKSLTERFYQFVPAIRIGAACMVGLAVLIFGRYGFGFTASEFIYSRF